MPRFTVLLPTHNRADVISYSIRSILAQTETSFELYVVGDGSVMRQLRLANIMAPDYFSACLFRIVTDCRWSGWNDSLTVILRSEHGLND